MIDFPASPTNGQVFTAPNGVVYVYDSTYSSWRTSTFVAPLSANFCAYGSTNVGGTATPTDMVSIAGNEGGWFVTATGRFTPPAGRYRLTGGFCATTPASAATLSATIRKNGVNIKSGAAASGAATHFMEVEVDVHVDANGTDWFDVQLSCAVTSANTTTWFMGFPLAIPTISPVMPGVFRQLGRIVPTAGQATVDFQNIPSDINNLHFMAEYCLPQTNDSYFAMRVFDAAGNIDAGGTSYHMAGIGNNDAAVLGSNAATSAYASGGAILFTYNQANSYVNNITAQGGISVEGKVFGIRNVQSRKAMTFNGHYLNGANTAFWTFNGMGGWHGANSTGLLTGLRFYWGTGNFAAGGAITLWGSP